VHVAVVGPGVEQAGALRRFGERDDRRPRADAIIARAILVSLFFTPIVTISSRFAPLVRSWLIGAHDNPRSAERKTRFAAA
jgi:hypothetical protein